MSAVVGTPIFCSTGGRRRNGVGVQPARSPAVPRDYADDSVADRPARSATAVIRQASLAKRMVNAGLPSVTGLPAADLARRPFLLFWFMSQIERCVSLLNSFLLLHSRA